jgi:CHASE3 domain sensor protein
MSFIDDMKIGKKILAGFIIIVLILVVLAIIGYTDGGKDISQGMPLT